MNKSCPNCNSPIKPVVKAFIEPSYCYSCNKSLIGTYKALYEADKVSPDIARANLKVSEQLDDLRWELTLSHFQVTQLMLALWLKKRTKDV